MECPFLTTHDDAISDYNRSRITMLANYGINGTTHPGLVKRADKLEVMILKVCKWYEDQLVISQVNSMP